MLPYFSVAAVLDAGGWLHLIYVTWREYTGIKVSVDAANIYRCGDIIRITIIVHILTDFKELLQIVDSLYLNRDAAHQWAQVMLHILKFCLCT